MPKFYLTTAIDYSNGEPHLGHALEKIGADCLARYRRLCGDEVHFVMGMDEHGQKVAQSAEKGGLPPQAWVDRIAGRFQQTWRRLLCSNDDWIRTTEPRHRAAVAAFIGRIRARNPDDIFIGDYEGLYCVGCEEFKQESQIVDGRCVEHPTLELVKTKERNYFFRLSRYARRIHELIVSGEFRVEPEIRRNEVLRQIEAGLQDGSISRARFPWGLPFPDAPDHTVYARFDARYGSELADTFGNLVKRSLDMIHRYRGGTVPGDPRGYRTPLEDAAQSALAAYRRAMDGFRLEEGAARWMELAARANRYIEETTPWNLAKQGHDAELDSVLANLARTVARLAVLALPFVPATAGSIWALLDAPPQPPQPLDRARLADLATLDLAGPPGP